MLKDPPALFVLHYAGHSIQTKTKTVYLVPSNTWVEHLDDLPLECLSLEKVLLTLRQELDEPVWQKFDKARAIVFLVVLDACLMLGSDQDQNLLGGALACEPSPESAPLKYTIVLLCSHNKCQRRPEGWAQSVCARAPGCKLWHLCRGCLTTHGHCQRVECAAWGSGLDQHWT